MKIGEIERLAAAGESETLELKRSTGGRRMGVRAVCAMLNHRGGRVLFGVAPDGRVLGQTVNDRTIERLVEELREIDPPAFPDIDRIATSGGLEVVVVTVPIVRHQSPTATGERLGAGSATPVNPCLGTNTTGCCSNGCTASTDGRMNPSRTGRSTIST